jgi:DNA-binding transcriptional MerR regulator
MNERINKESLLELAKTILKKDNQVKIASLSDELTISQVVKFFEKQGRNLTKTMIQNYIRVGVLPPPIEKRYYTKDHLVLLTLIDNLKSIYSLEEIKSLFEPIRNDPNIFEDDVIKAMDIYTNYLTMRKEALDKWEESLPNLFDKVEKLVEKDKIEDHEKDDAVAFLIALTVMAETIAMKDLVICIVDRYIRKQVKN